MVYDIVVYGASGYTGRLTSLYLANLLQASARTFAIAGRSKQKLEAIAKESGRDLPMIIADASDASSLDSMCQQAKCIIACVGPFALYGMPLVEACVKHNVHYVDITGEFTFVRAVIEKFDAQAKAQGTILVPCSGFDSVPSDICNHFAYQLAAERGFKLNSVHCMYRAKGGVSRGTLDSACNIFKEVTKADMHPLSLVPKADRPKSVKTPSQKGLWYDTTTKRFTAPFLMAGTNEKVVRKSNVLLNRDASYYESVSGGLIHCIVNAVVLYLAALLMIPMVQRLCKKYVFPAPGTGPSDEARKKFRFAIDIVGKCKGGKTVVGELKSEKDAYLATGIFASELALAIVNGEITPAHKAGGVLTPAAAAGDALLRRLRDAGMTIASKI